MTTSALSSRNFLIYLAGSVVSLHGLWVYRVALAWFAWQLSASELWVGIVAFTQFAPAVVFGPLFGVLADRFDRRRASVLINTLSSMNMLLLFVLTSLGHVDIVVLTIISLMQGTLEGAHTPVRMTIVPNLVNKEQLQSAIAHMSISFNVSRFIGPALSGIIIATYGVGTAFAVNGISFLAFVAAILIVQLKPAADRSAAPGDVWSDLLVGVRYVLGHGTIRALLIIIAVASIFGRGALEMMPALADLVFQRGSSGLAILTSAIGAGAIATGLILVRSTTWLSTRSIRISVGIGGILIAILGANDTFWIAIPVVASLGVVLTLCGVGSQILIQNLVDDELRGRVSSFWGMIAFGGTAIGSLIVGLASVVFGLQNTIIATGLLCSLATLLTSERAR